MEIGGSTGTGPQLPSPLSETAPAPKKITDAKTMSIGEQLNQIGGIQTEKDLYAPKNELGKDAFLKMFMEQLKYQDPMNPVKNEQFSQQMAAFGQLEQQVNMNKTLEKLASQQNNMQIAALQLVGKQIVADRGSLYHDKNKYTAINFKLPQDVQDLKLEIVDGTGEVTKTYSLGTRNEGDVAWKWDGLKEGGQPAESGRYGYRVKAKDSAGKDVVVNTKVEGRVTGVTSSNGVVYLMVGEQKIGLNDVELIKEATPAPSNTVNPSAKEARVEKLPGTKTEVTKDKDKEEVEEGRPSIEDLSDQTSRMNALMPLYSR